MLLLSILLYFLDFLILKVILESIVLSVPTTLSLLFLEDENLLLEKNFTIFVIAVIIFIIIIIIIVDIITNAVKNFTRTIFVRDIRWTIISFMKNIIIIIIVIVFIIIVIVVMNTIKT